MLIFPLDPTTHLEPRHFRSGRDLEELAFVGFDGDEAISGDTAEEVALSVAKFTDTGEGTTRNPVWMYEQWLGYIDEGTARDTDSWDQRFLDQSGQNVNTAINGVAKLLKKLSR